MKQFQLLIKPAAGDCNLECGYCFYRRVNDFFPESKTHRMPDEVLEQMLSDLLSYRFPETIVCWQGGEPTTLGLDFFQQAVRLEMKHGRHSQVMGNAFQTNGVLIDEDWARFLSRYKFLVGLSIDGPREIHDHYRKFRSGQGSFDRALAAAELFQRHRVAFNILCVVSKASAGQAREIYRFYRAQGFDYLQFVPCLELDPQTGQLAEFSATPEIYGEFLVDLFEEWWKEGCPHVQVRMFEALYRYYRTGAPGLCTLSRRCGEYLVVEHNGDVYPCDFYVRPETRLGNVMHTRLADFFHHPLQREFKRQKELADQECRRCKWWRLCHGGCPKDWLDEQGQPAFRSRFCQAYQMLFEASEKKLRRLAGSK